MLGEADAITVGIIDVEEAEGIAVGFTLEEAYGTDESVALG